MTTSLLQALVLLNTLLAASIVYISTASGPEMSRMVDMAVPASSSDSSVVERTADQPNHAETTMFGPGGTSETKPIDLVPAPPPRSDGDDITLLGVLIGQQEGGRQSVVSLLRHGSPPAVTRLTLGGTLDGWTLVSATRTTIKLLGRDGTTRVIQVGATAKAKTAR